MERTGYAQYNRYMTHTLTAIILCHNAAPTIERTLESLRWCTDTIVVDDGSDDESEKIGKKFGVRWERLEPTDSFANKRAWALAHATGEYVLFVDADEIVSPELAASIQAALQSPDSADGYLVRRQDIFLGRILRYGEAGQMWLLRLYRRDKGNWVHRVHEVVRVSGTTAKLSGTLLHTPHPSLTTFLHKINRYTDLMAKDRIEEGRVPPLVLLYLQLFLYPIGKFIYNFFFKRGFLDGMAGFIMAWMMSLHSLTLRIKLIEYRSSV